MYPLSIRPQPDKSSKFLISWLFPGSSAPQSAKSGDSSSKCHCYSGSEGHGFDPRRFRLYLDTDKIFSELYKYQDQLVFMCFLLLLLLFFLLIIDRISTWPMHTSVHGTIPQLVWFPASTPPKHRATIPPPGPHEDQVLWQLCWKCHAKSHQGPVHGEQQPTVDNLTSPLYLYELQKEGGKAWAARFPAQLFAAAHLLKPKRPF